MFKLEAEVCRRNMNHALTASNSFSCAIQVAVIVINSPDPSQTFFSPFAVYRA